MLERSGVSAGAGDGELLRVAKARADPPGGRERSNRGWGWVGSPSTTGRPMALIMRHAGAA